MLRKLQQNIFPHIGRQVNGIILDGRLFRALQGQMQGPGREADFVPAGAQAAGTFAIKRQFEEPRTNRPSPAMDAVKS